MYMQQVNKHVIVIKKLNNLSFIRQDTMEGLQVNKLNLYLLPQPGPSSRFTVRLFSPLPFQLTLILRN